MGKGMGGKGMGEDEIEFLCPKIPLPQDSLASFA
jgi:hypothetical protein